MKFRAYGNREIEKISFFQNLSRQSLTEIKAVSAVLPFRINNYVIEELIDSSQIPMDPMYQMTIPQPGMLDPEDLDRMCALIHRNAPQHEISAEARNIQMRLNPHPSGQMELNVPVEDGILINGMQHKYRETLLFFPSQGQTCHAYCTYCFRWAQFIDLEELKFATRETDALIHYLKRHPEVTDILFTGGDPLVMKTRLLRRYIEPLLKAGLEQLRSIRIGTKSMAYWPYRFLTDPDADDLMRLFEEVTAHGIHLALMAHYSHPRELRPAAAQAALKRIIGTGAVVRCQAPLIRHVNDDAQIWADLWNLQVRMGAVPYYMFVERDTGPKEYFQVPLHRCLDIFTEAYAQVSGLGRTVRGPTMSATPGKVIIEGVCTIMGRRYFVLKLIQGRDHEWVNQIFLAEHSTEASWLDELAPAFGQPEFFFEPRLREMKQEKLADQGKHVRGPFPKWALADLAE